MCLILCDLCNESAWDQPHVCDPAKARAYVAGLREQARAAEHRLRQVQNAVLMLLEPLPDLGEEYATVKTEWLRKLWDATRCQWWGDKTPDIFLSRWAVTHHVLVEAFYLFRSKKRDGKGYSPVERLAGLKAACDAAKKLMYPDPEKSSPLDLTAEDVLVKAVSG